MKWKSVLKFLVRWEIGWLIKSLITHQLSKSGVRSKHKVLRVLPILTESGDSCNINECQWSKYDDKEFDYVLVQNALPFVKPNQVKSVLDELGRIGKKVIITLPSPMWLVGFYLAPGMQSRIYRLATNVIVVKGTLLGERYDEKLILDSNVFEVYT